MRTLRPLLVCGVILGCAPAPSPVSPLALTLNRQAGAVATGAEIVLSDSVAAAASPVSLPADVVPELRTMHPQVGLEDSIRALFRAPFGRSAIGYILRLPSTEGPYLALTVYRATDGHWTAPIMLAQVYGDPGFSRQGRSWLLDLDGDGYFEIVSRWQTSDFDTEREDEPPIVTDSLAVLRLEEGQLRATPAGAGDALWMRFCLPNGS